MATITTKDKTSIQAVIPTSAKVEIDAEVQRRGVGNDKEYAISDLIRDALTEYFEKRERHVDFTVDRGGYRQRRSA